MLLVYHAGTAHNLSGPELLHLNSVIKALVSMFWLHSIIVVFLKSDGWVHYLLFLLTIGWTLFRQDETKLHTVVYYHEAECHAEKLVHFLQCQGHSKGLCNQNMTIFTIPSKLLVGFQPNLV